MNARTLAVATALAVTLVTASPASAQDTPYSTNLRIAQTVAAQSARFPAPDTCETVGGWEDGSMG